MILNNSAEFKNIRSECLYSVSDIRTHKIKIYDFPINDVDGVNKKYLDELNKINEIKYKDYLEDYVTSAILNAIPIAENTSESLKDDLGDTCVYYNDMGKIGLSKSLKFNKSPDFPIVKVGTENSIENILNIGKNISIKDNVLGSYLNFNNTVLTNKGSFNIKSEKDFNIIIHNTKILEGGGNINITAGNSENFSGCILLKSGEVPYKNYSSIKINGFLENNFDSNTIEINSEKTILNKIVKITDNFVTIDPSRKSGNFFRKNCSLNVEGPVCVNGLVHSRMFGCLSDKRFKKDIKKIYDPLYSIKNINAYTYKWKDDKIGRKHVGFIAQEIEKTEYDYLVYDGDVKTVDYNSFVPLLLECIKTLDEKNIQFEKRIKCLEERYIRKSNKKSKKRIIKL